MNTHVPTFERIPKADVAWLGTDPIPAKPYYDPTYFDLEREAIFKRSWLQVGHVCELPESGSFIRRELEIARASILIVRGRDDEIRAFHNVCTHRGTQLVDAEAGKQSKFSCRYHMWTFDGDGRLLSAPDFDQFYVDKAQCSLKQIKLEVCAGLIFVHLGSPETSLQEELGELVGRLEQLPVAQATTFSEYTYEIDANWKLTFDNFQENYHLRFIHPQTAAAGCAEENPFGYPSKFGFHGSHRTQSIWANPAAKMPDKVQAQAYMRTGAALARRNLIEPETGKEYFALFPNFFLFGSPGQHFSHTVMPIAPERTRGIIRLYWVGDDHDASERFAREFSMAVARDIHSEDRSVIEAGQRGLSSGALDHIHFQAQEALCRHMFNEVDAKVQAYKAELEINGPLA